MMFKPYIQENLDIAYLPKKNRINNEKNLYDFHKKTFFMKII
jgi:hypothetical protein